MLEKNGQKILMKREHSKIFFPFVIIVFSLIMGVVISLFRFERLEVTTSLTFLLVILFPMSIKILRQNKHNLDVFEPILLFFSISIIHFVLPVWLWKSFNIQFRLYRNPDVNRAILTYLLAFLFYIFGYYLFFKNTNILLNTKKDKILPITWNSKKARTIGNIFVIFSVAIYIYRFWLAGGFFEYLSLLQYRLIAFQGQGYILAGKFIPIPILIISLIEVCSTKETKRRDLFRVILIALISIAQLYLGGGRASFILVLLIIFAMINYFKKKVSINIILTFTVLAMVFSFYYLVFTRGTIKIDNSKIIQEINYVTKSAVTAGDLNEIFVFSDVLTKVPYQIPYQYGKTYLALVTLPIPSKIYPNKLPEAGYFWTQSVYPDYSKYSSLGMPCVGELYLNFGYFGIMLGMFLLGSVSKLLYLHVMKNLTIGSGFFYAVFIYFFYLYLTRGFVIALYPSIIILIIGLAIIRFSEA
jgi:oligosaccharide repeat unit polymerase